jgi:hypothetical protein
MFLYSPHALCENECTTRKHARILCVMPAYAYILCSSTRLDHNLAINLCIHTKPKPLKVDDAMSCIDRSLLLFRTLARSRILIPQVLEGFLLPASRFSLFFSPFRIFRFRAKGLGYFTLSAKLTVVA